MSWYIPQGMLKSLTKSQLSQKHGKMNGTLNNSAVGQVKGKLLMSPQPVDTLLHNYTASTNSVDTRAVPHQEGGKRGQRSPGTGWSQKEKLKDPEGHSKAVSEGVNRIPHMAALGAMTTLGGAPILLGSTAAAAGIDIVKRGIENVVDFYSGANKKLK